MASFSRQRRNDGTRCITPWLIVAGAALIVCVNSQVSGSVTFPSPFDLVVASSGGNATTTSNATDDMNADAIMVLANDSFSCTDGSGQSQFCAPWQPLESILENGEVNSLATLSASSTCNSSDSDPMVCESGSCLVYCPSGVSIENLLNESSLYDWRSELFTDNATSVIVDIDLGRSYILFLVGLVFPAGTAPDSVRLERSRSSSAQDSSASFSLVKELSSIDTSSDVLFVPIIDFATYSDDLNTNAGVSKLRETAETQSLRITFLQASGNPNVTGSGSATFFYALSRVIVMGVCQCNGHARECSMGVCECTHNTTGDDCSQCNSIGDNSTVASMINATRASRNSTSGTDFCAIILPSSDDDDGGLSTTTIIIIAACGGGALLILIVILIIIGCVRRRREGFAIYSYDKEEITVIDATGLRQVTIKNKGYADDQSSLQETSS